MKTIHPVIGALIFTLALAARLDAQTAGTLDPNYNPGVPVIATAQQPDGKTIIGGPFTTVGGEAHQNIARLNRDGSVDSTFNASVNSSQVRSLAVQADGKVLLSGDFTAVNGVTRNRIARLNADGSLESTATFNPGNGANAIVWCMALQVDGKIVLVGNFTTVNGTASTRIARLNVDGSVESNATFNPGTGANAHIVTVAIQTDGKIVIGGNFTTFNGVARNYVARLNSDGTLESTATFNPGLGPNNILENLTVQSDGKILLGGDFTAFNGAARNHIARLNADGTLESTATFNIGTGANGIVSSFAVQTDGKILISGLFTAINSATRNHFARLNVDGTLDSITNFNPGTGANNNVPGIAVQSDGTILLCASYTAVNGTPRNGFARLYNDAVTQSLSAPNVNQVQWLRGGAGPEVMHVTLELSTNGGSSWSALGVGTRITGGWQLSGLSLPASGLLRARGRTANGYLNGSSDLIEQVAAFSFATSIQEWKLATLGDANALDLGDPDFDGLLTLAEYALGTLPQWPNPTPLAVTRFVYPEGERLRMFVPRDPAHNDITVEVQATGDLVLGPWTTLAASTLGAPFAGPGYVSGDSPTPGVRTVEVRDTVNLSSTTQRWMRVKVTAAP